VNGTLAVPGDKSISHRALLLGAVAHGPTVIRGLLRSEDCIATLRALRTLGVPINEEPDGTIRIHGAGPEAFREPLAVLDCGNSGTSLRLLAGLLAARPFCSVLTGDASLVQRPMRRVAEPLRAMGATIFGRADGQFPPLAIRGGALSGIHWTSPVASAQVKSAVLLAGLQAAGETSVTAPLPSRDHTERMLAAFGAAPQCVGTTVTVRGGTMLQGTAIIVPGDLSSAAFFLVAAAARPGGFVQIAGVGVNPTRTGLLEVLAQMGARLETSAAAAGEGEPVGDLRVEGARLAAVSVDAAIVPRLIDEIPVLAVAAALAKGASEFSGLGELRVKEVDRLAAIREELGKLGADISVTGDRLCIQGGRPLRGAVVSSGGDHRMAMSLAVAALFAAGETTIRDVGCVETSFPGFARMLAALAPGAGLREVEEHG
jgi:3-phosphoshikimate 1-carboxyvinyltransferase